MLNKIASKYLEKVAEALTEQQLVAKMTPKALQAWKAMHQQGRAALMKTYNQPQKLPNGATYKRKNTIDIDDKGVWQF